MQSEFRVIEPDVFPLHENSAYFNAEVKDKDHVYKCLVVDKYNNLACEKEIIIYVVTAAILKIIHEPNVFGSPANALWYLVSDALIMGFYKEVYFYQYHIKQQEFI